MSRFQNMNQLFDVQQRRQYATTKHWGKYYNKIMITTINDTYRHKINALYISSKTLPISWFSNNNNNSNATIFGWLCCSSIECVCVCVCYPSQMLYLYDDNMVLLYFIGVVLWITMFDPFIKP